MNPIEIDEELLKSIIKDMKTRKIYTDEILDLALYLRQERGSTIKEIALYLEIEKGIKANEKYLSKVLKKHALKNLKTQSLGEWSLRKILR